MIPSSKTPLSGPEKTGRIVREYTHADIPAMTKIWNEVVMAGEAFPQDEPLNYENGADFFKSQSRCGVYEEHGRILGLYILHPNNVGRCGHICNASYAVTGAARGKGIGRILVLDSLAQAAGLGFGIMQFNAVVFDNHAARKLYPELGFRELGVIHKGFRAKNGAMKDICLYWRPLDDMIAPDKQ